MVTQYFRGRLALLAMLVLTSACGHAEGGETATTESATQVIGQGGANLSEESRIYNGQVIFTVQGWEFRDSSSYPSDKAGPGVKANARNDLRGKCQDLITSLKTDLGTRLTAGACIDEKDVATKAGRSQFEAKVSLQIALPHIVQQPYLTKIEGRQTYGKDFNSPYPSQDARALARSSYEDACEAFQREAQTQYGKYLLFVDCGKLTENGGTGWHFESKPTVYYYSDDPPPRNCGSHLHRSRWYDLDPNDPIRVNINCEFGGSAQEIYENYKQYTCEDGQVLATGLSRQGNVLQTIGRCEVPMDCGYHSHGSRWWEVDRQNNIREDMRCEFGGRQVAVYEREYQARCWDGSILSTGFERRGRLIGYYGQCNRPRSCGSHPHDDTWWERDYNNPIVEYERCQWGGRRVTYYERLRELHCWDGRVDGRRERRGGIIRREDNCMAPPPQPPPEPRPPRPPRPPEDPRPPRDPRPPGKPPRPPAHCGGPHQPACPIFP